jgi:hypothetical protein
LGFGARLVAVGLRRFAASPLGFCAHVSLRLGRKKEEEKEAKGLIPARIGEP